MGWDPEVIHELRHAARARPSCAGGDRGASPAGWAIGCVLNFQYGCPDPVSSKGIRGQEDVAVDFLHQVHMLGVAVASTLRLSGQTLSSESWRHLFTNGLPVHCHSRPRT